jgi:hypothetical protein
MPGRSLLLLLALLSFRLGAEEAQAPLPVLPQMVLRDGTVLKAVKVVNAAGNNSVLARWEGGRGTIALADFSPQMRAELQARWPQLAKGPELHLEARPREQAVVVIPEPKPEGRLVEGMIYLGAEGEEDKRAYLSKATLKAYPLKDYIAATQTGAQGPMPEPFSTGASDEKGHWSLTVPPGAEFMVEAEAVHQAGGPRGSKIRWTWRVPSSDLEEGKVLDLTDRNAALGTRVSKKPKAIDTKPKKKFLFW